MPECWVASTINYTLGLVAGWWIWGRRLRDLRAAVERHTTEASAILKGSSGSAGGSNPTGPEGAGTMGQ